MSKISPSTVTEGTEFSYPIVGVPYRNVELHVDVILEHDIRILFKPRDLRAFIKTQFNDKHNVQFIVVTELNKDR